MERPRHSQWRRRGLKWSRGGSWDQWSQILITLMRNSIAGSVTASKWKQESGFALMWCGSATPDTSSGVCTVGKSMLAAKRKAALSFVEFSSGSATLDAPSACWLLSEKPHSHWLNWRAGTSWASWAWRRGMPPSPPWVSWPGQAPASSHSPSHALKIFSPSNFMYV